jgi:hypothetical protein
MYRADLEQTIDRKLHRLPPPAAPDTLLPRVMAAVRLWAARPWYQRAWFTWPIGLQLASSFVLIATLAAVVFGLPQAVSLAGHALSVALAGMTRGVPNVPERVVAATSAAQILWQALIHPLLVYACLVVIVLCLACVSVAVALNHVVFGRTAQS